MVDTVVTPKQQEILDDVLAIGSPRPEFDPEVAGRLVEVLRGQLQEYVDQIPHGEQLAVSNYQLQQVLGCERRWVEDRWSGWTIEKLRGTIAHRAIERLIFAQQRPIVPELTPHAAVLEACDRMVDEDSPRGFAEFFGALSSEDRHELLREATDAALKFEVDWPSLKLEWRPRVETRRHYSLFGDDERIMLRGKFDLALGRSVGNQAKILIVDLKTGNRHDSHASQLRFYALLETLAGGLPPFRIAAYYLDSGQYWTEDVSEATLELATRRAVDGVRRMIELRYGSRFATETAGPLCRYCEVLDLCSTGQHFVSEHDVEFA